jgi:hypothetical protein
MFPYADATSDRYQLWFSYDNRPNANVSSVSPDHEGVCWLEMNLSLDRNMMKGRYYTSRSTSGNERSPELPKALRLSLAERIGPPEQILTNFENSNSHF